MDSLINAVLGRITGTNPENAIWCLIASTGQQDEFGKIVDVIPLNIEEHGTIPDAVKVELLMAFLSDMLRDKNSFYLPELADSLDVIRDRISMERFKQRRNIGD